MFAYLKGTVEEVSENRLTLDVNDVGYSLICSARTISDAKEQGGVVKLYTVLNIREDAWTLFGFFTENEKFWFNTLNSVQGVGGKVAISILSVLSNDDIYNTFLSEDKSAFTRADGVGPKLAARIISELKDKVVGKVELNKVVSTKVAQSSVLNDVISALMNLGYQKSEVLRIVSSMNIDENAKFDILVKEILGRLSAGG